MSGSPTGTLLWGRPDLVEYAGALATLLSDPDPALGAKVDQLRSALAGLAYARWGLAWARFDRDALPRGCDLFDQLWPDDTTGIAATIRSATALAFGDMRTATAIRAAAIADPRMGVGGRDITTAIAVYGASSSGMRDLVSAEWMQRTAELAAVCQVPAIRRLAQVALSVAVTETEPERSVSLLHEAFADPDPVPAYWDRLIGTFLSRYLTRTSPSQAARHLLRLLPDLESGFAAADAVTLATAAGLLVSTNHRSADDVVTSLTKVLSSQHIASIVGGANERGDRGVVLDKERVVPILRMALEEIASVNGRAAGAPL